MTGNIAETQCYPVSGTKTYRLRILLYIFSLMPFFLFSGIEDLLGETLREIWQLAGLALMTVELLHQDRIRPDRCIVCFTLYELLVLTVTTLGTEFRPGIVITVLAYILITFLIRNDRKNVLPALCLLLGIALFLNTVSMVLVGTGGFYKSYFIGGKNSLSIVLVPGIFLMYLLYLEYKGSVYTNRLYCLYLLFFLLSVASMIYGKSGTGVVMGCVAFFTIFFRKRFHLKKASVFLILGLLYSLILFGQSFFQSQFWLDFTDLLDKDPTLTYRTSVWKGATDIFRAEPLFGHGRIFRIWYTDEFNLLYSVRESHNFILQVLCDGGIVGAILYGTSLVDVFSGLSLNDERQRTVFTALILLLINGLTETVNYNILTVILPALAMSYVTESNCSSNKKTEVSM